MPASDRLDKVPGARVRDVAAAWAGRRDYTSARSRPGLSISRPAFLNPMSLRRRILRITITVLVVLAFAGYFAFSTLLFSPLEDDYPFELASLVPRDVDYFAAKRDLADDFGTFPELAVAETLAESEAGRLLLSSPEWAEWRAELDLDAKLEELRAQLATLPIDVDPLELFGGREILMAGYFRGKELGDSDFVALGRTNWMGKMGVALLDYPSLLGLEDQGVSVSSEGGVMTLNSVDFLRPLHVVRIADVLVVGSSRELVAGALELDQKKGQDSFRQSARYADYIAGLESREPEDVELFLDYSALNQNLGVYGNVPDRDSEEFTPAFVARLFQAKLVKELEGVLGFASGFSVNLHADLNSELLTPEQTRFYRHQGFNRDTMFDVAGMAPADTAALAYLQLDMGDLMRMILDSTEDAAQENFHDLVRSVWGYPDGTALIDELASGLRDRAALVVRTNDYPDEGASGPPNDGDRVFVWAAIGWHKDQQVLEEFRTKIVNRQGEFGISGRESGSQGVFRNTLSEGGITVYEFWSQLVPGTGHMAMVISDDTFIVGNHASLLADIILTKYGVEGHPALAEDVAYSSQVRLGLDSASAMVYLAPQRIREDLRAMASQLAADQIVINWPQVHQETEQAVLQERFGGRSRDFLGPNEVEELDQLVETRKNEYEANLVGQHVPEIRARFNRYVDYAMTVGGMLLQLSLDPKRMDLAWRTAIPLQAEL